VTPTFFESRAAFRAWLARHGRSTTELWVGFHKKRSGRSGITYQDAVDEALCAGWIDGLKKRHDESSYVHRFSPRKPKSKWSLVNLRRMRTLLKQGLVTEIGRQVFDDRHRTASGYSYETRPQTLDPDSARRLKANAAAWRFFEAQPPGYRRLVTYWVCEAKRDATRVRRLEQVIACSARGARIPLAGGSSTSGGSSE
jgi:uncharacterized protein YdeI (YjbR/CyaY-like superfamily)